VWLVAGVLLFGCAEHVTEVKQTRDDTQATTSTAEATNTSEESQAVQTQAWGEADGKQVFLYRLTNDNGTVVKLTNWGSTITELHAKDKDGQLADVVLGFESLDRWLHSDAAGKPNPAYFGCTVGRYCNRIANGKFELDGVAANLPQNNGPNHLHGGEKGWDKHVWDGEVVHSDEGQAVRFTLTSPDGDQGYPGEVKAEVVYTLTDDDEIRIQMSATSDKPTPVNMTNHTYFNLAGEGTGTILDHQLKLETDRITVFGEGDIPTGQIKSTADTPFDFTKPTRIGDRIDQLTGDPGGYDQNFVLRDEKISQPQLAATVHDPSSGRTLEVYTTEVGVQFYTGNYLDGTLKGKSGQDYPKHFALCLEPQFHPDSPNKPDFPSSILQPGDKYQHTTVYKLGVRP